MVMKIKEVSEKTGLTKKTIRFYEEEGLIQPEKTYYNGRAYRDYTQAHVDALKEIAVLRRARFSVEEIKTISSAPEEIPAVFDSYCQRLQQEQQTLAQVLAVVRTIPTDTLTSKQALVAQIEPGTRNTALPAADIHPHFRYLDTLEAKLMKRKKKLNMTEEELHQHQMAAKNAALYAGTTPQNSTGSNMAACGDLGGFDLPNSQKIAAFHLLMHDRD